LGNKNYQNNRDKLQGITSYACFVNHDKTYTYFTQLISQESA